MKTKIYWKYQARSTYENLSLEAQYATQECLAILKLGRPMPNEIILPYIPECIVILLRSGHFLMFSRRIKKLGWRDHVIITVEHIASTDKFLMIEYLESQTSNNGAGAVKTSPSYKDVLDDAQRISFMVQVIGVMTSIVLAFLSLYGFRIPLLMTPAESPAQIEEDRIDQELEQKSDNLVCTSLLVRSCATRMTSKE